MVNSRNVSVKSKCHCLPILNFSDTHLPYTCISKRLYFNGGNYSYYLSLTLNSLSYYCSVSLKSQSLHSCRLDKDIYIDVLGILPLAVS